MQFRFEVSVLPGSKQTAITIEEQGLRVHLRAQPVEGKANEALIKLLSKTLSVSKSSITIHRGSHGRRKMIFIEAETLPEPYLSLSRQNPGRHA